MFEREDHEEDRGDALHNASKRRQRKQLITKVGAGAIVLFLFYAAIGMYSVSPYGGAVEFDRTDGTFVAIEEKGYKHRWLGFESKYEFKVDDLRLVRENIEAPTADGQRVDMTVMLRYHLDPDHLVDVLQQYRSNAGVKAALTPILDDAVKVGSVQFQAAELMENRDKVRPIIVEELTPNATELFVVIDQLSIVDMQFSEEFSKILEETGAARQQKRTEENLRDVAIIAAERRVVEAMGVRNATIARAEGSAEEVRLLTEQLLQSPLYLDYLATMQWNGETCQTCLFGGGDSGLPGMFRVVTGDRQQGS